MVRIPFPIRKGWVSTGDGIMEKLFSMPGNRAIINKKQGRLPPNTVSYTHLAQSGPYMEQLKAEDPHFRLDVQGVLSGVFQPDRTCLLYTSERFAP